MFDLVIRGGEVVTEEGVYSADLALKAGRTEGLLAPGERARPAAEDLDASGRHIFPGLVDCHVHFNEPGRTHWEGFERGSRAAAAGGVTTVFDMPLNCQPPTLDVAALEAKRAAVGDKSVVDYAFWGGLVDDNTVHLADLQRAGVVGCKAFLCDSAIDEYPRAGDGILLEGMRRLAALDGILGLHAEAHEATGHLGRRLREAGRSDPRAWAESRPPATESMAVDGALRLAAETGCRVHFVHLSAPESVRLVVESRRRG